jgi:hypothetical protein
MKQVICVVGVIAAILAISFPAAALPIGPYDVDANTIALYHLDGFEGLKITPDAVGFHPGTVFGDTSVTSGKFGNALSFDGNGDYVRLGTCSFLCRSAPPQDSGLSLHLIHNGQILYTPTQIKRVLITSPSPELLCLTPER